MQHGVSHLYVFVFYLVCNAVLPANGNKGHDGQKDTDCLASDVLHSSKGATEGKYPCHAQEDMVGHGVPLLGYDAASQALQQP
jgi:hypothetical protein